MQEVIPVKKNRAYRAIDVKRIKLERLLSGREGQRATVGLDISKEEVWVVVRWEGGEFERPWRAKSPREVPVLVEQLVELSRGREVTVALEPTGTYGDPLRQALEKAGLTVHRVSPKASHDYAEVFDGVPSQHDGKDAAVVAELAALGKSARWPLKVDEWEQELAKEVDWLETQRRMLTMWYGRLEGLLARHWPEATRTLPVSSGVLLHCLAHHGGPAALSADAAAEDRLWKWGRGHLSREKAKRLLDDARGSVGVRQTGPDIERIKRYARQALESRGELASTRRGLAAHTADHGVIQAQAKAVGVVTACVLWAHLGDPRGYDSGPAYRKAMGLNLKERSSGKWVGQVKITKRGHSQVRRWLYYGALRLIRQEGVRQWYEGKKARGSDRHEARRALVGVMRKLALVLYQLPADGREFEVGKLFPGRGKRRGRQAARV